MRLIALERFYYQQRYIEAGEEFNSSSDLDAMLLTRAPHPRAAELKEQEKPKRKYRRRDMRAEA